MYIESTQNKSNVCIYNWMSHNQAKTLLLMLPLELKQSFQNLLLYLKLLIHFVKSITHVFWSCTPPPPAQLDWHAYELTETVTHLHRFKSDWVPAWREWSRHKVPHKTKRLFTTDTRRQRESQFSPMECQWVIKKKTLFFKCCKFPLYINYIFRRKIWETPPLCGVRVWRLTATHLKRALRFSGSSVRPA